MTVIKIVAFLSLVIFVSWLLIRMQRYSQAKYNFPPFNLRSFGLLILGLVLFFLSIYVLPDAKSMNDVFAAIKSISFPEPISNSIALVVLSALVVCIVYGLTAVATNPFIALIAIVFQLVGSLLFIPVFVLLLLPGGEKKKRRRRKKRVRI